jgi:deoxyribose-phosphate aldolase
MTAASSSSLVLPGDVPDLREFGSSESALRRFLHGLPGVDEVGVEARVAALGTRSLKRDAKTWALDLAIRAVDLTTLEGADTAGKVHSLAGKARQPDPSDPTCPSVAAVCVYPDMVETAVEALVGSGVHVAAVATAFPSGRASLDIKQQDTRDAIRAGADEIDMVIDRGAFLAGDYARVFEEIVAIKAVCDEVGASLDREVHLKVILETGELQTYDNVRRASWLALAAGGDVIKTSTGKVSPASTLPVTAVMLQAVRMPPAQPGCTPTASGSVPRRCSTTC